VGRVLEEACRLLSSSGLDYEVLVCDDGSTDATGAIIDEVRRHHPEIRLLRHTARQGIFRTFEALYAAATRDWVFLNATDGQWKTDVLFELLPLTEDADIVVASRRHKHYTPVRQLISWAFNAVPPLLFGVKTYDAGAVKLVRRSIITSLPLVSQSPFSEAERLIRAARRGYRIIEHPVETGPREGGMPRGGKWALVRAALADVVRLWLALRREARGERRVTIDEVAPSDRSVRP
jgi:glycosyltransferase involved in cell wall biosynthesis